MYSIEVGFYWWDNEISLALRVYIPKKEKNKDAAKIKKFFDTKLPDWETEDWDDAYNFWHYDYVAKFIIDNEEQIPSMISFLKEGINKLEHFKD